MSYKVTIKKEGSQYVARDENGDWRTKGDASGAPATEGRELVLYLFHAEEVESVAVQGGVTTAEIKTF